MFGCVNPFSGQSMLFLTCPGGDAYICTRTPARTSPQGNVEKPNHRQQNPPHRKLTRWLLHSVCTLSFLYSVHLRPEYHAQFRVVTPTHQLCARDTIAAMLAATSKPTLFKGIRGQLTQRCGHCRGAGCELSMCTGCRVVRYCCREHQVVDRPQHKHLCNNIKKQRVEVAKEEDEIRHATPDFMTPANAFETHVGHFWGLMHTRNYMRARFFLADAA